MVSKSLEPDVFVYLCSNCNSNGARLPRQWQQDRVHVRVTELPCSGKTDLQYLFHTLEAGARGVLVVTCPEGDCQLAQGNYRAELRIRTMQRLLGEIGVEPERAALVLRNPDDDLEALVRNAVQQFCALGDNPVCAGR